MGEVEVKTKKIEIDVNQEKIDYINYVYNKAITYWKKAATHNDEPRTFINDIPTEEPSFEAITNYLKTFSKYVKEDENMSLKNKCLFGGWILMASKVYRRENLSCRFEDWLYCLCKIMKFF